MTETKLRIALAVKTAREQKGLNRYGLSKRLSARLQKDIHTTNINKVERAENYTIDSLLAMLDELGLDLDVKSKE